MKNKNRYNSLEDFLISNPLSVDGQLSDGWEALFPVKGREIEATILFADISSFSDRTLNLSPTEILIFVNHFFTWISAEALRERPGIIDKYIGDEIMVIFSEEFGSEDPFVDAVQTARWMADQDAFSFCPHIGIASGKVTVGFVGTPLKYNCSVFGKPVNLASRCANVKSETSSSAFIVFPNETWNNRVFKDVIPQQMLPKWELLPPRTVKMKNMPEIEIREIVRLTEWFPTQSVEERAKESLKYLQEKGMYRPLGND